jgi:hypothetical protein
MEPLTEAHLATGDRNRDLARALIGPSAAALPQPPTLEWALVVAFYAAVHYVNAYLWEQQRYEPHRREDRVIAVGRVIALRRASAAYARLQTLGYDARYRAGYRATRAAVEAAIHTDLEQVAQAVRRALGIETADT